MAYKEELYDRINTALGAMSDRPRPLVKYLQKPGPDFDEVNEDDIESMLSIILSPNPNDSYRIRFSNLLHSWDNVKDAPWVGGTVRNSAARRKQIHKLLGTNEKLIQRIDSLVPFFLLEEPLIIAEDHEDWYAPSNGVRDYYWRTYKKYLEEHRDWSYVALMNLDNSTRTIVECLANPESEKVYSSRGLVIGYVQSGKTANFAGVVARAADAGYRMIIVLAGTWNILRNQTQRRFDKELLGKELLHNDESYQTIRPADWDEFLEHGAYPGDTGHYVWQRLTRPDIDFKGLKAAIDSLEYDKRKKNLPLYHPENLHHLPVKLLVIKKNSHVLRKLASDLGKLRTQLAEIPALIIDDESDQAGLNTVDPGKAQAGKERTSTNEAITHLLKLLPRGQYVGYSATPYANALVNPDDPEDLFPKDFIVSLHRPVDYMGVSDFFDPYVDYEDLAQNDFSQPEVAFIRRVDKSQDEDDEDLKQALRSYVIAGAVKLYRQSVDPGRYRPGPLRHHTMLIHTSSRKGAHATLAGRIRLLWDQCAFNTPAGLVALKKLWESDFCPVSMSQGKDEVIPASFEVLKSHLAMSVRRITQGSDFVCVVNSESDEAPDFTEGPVWKIIVGGNKLSRGYTIEGLTISYYRRIANTADTLMQMGRWFGFRPGYRDLVRVFLGVREGKDRNSDLVSLFKEVCRMEESFRDDIKRYLRRPGAPKITPRQIPPLIAIAGNLPPTARNKMFNAKIERKNFGGRWSTLTLTARRTESMQQNIKALETLLVSSSNLGRRGLGGVLDNGENALADCLLFEASNSDFIDFLRAYRWLESEYKHPRRPPDVELQIEFLQNQDHEIVSWLLLFPQRKTSYGTALTIKSVGSLTVKQRSRVAKRRFGIFGESSHHAIAEFFVSKKDKQSIKLAGPNNATKELLNPKRAVALFYPVREEEHRPVTLGFELLFPENNLPFDLSYTVRQRSKQIIVQAPTGHARKM